MGKSFDPNKEKCRERKKGEEERRCWQSGEEGGRGKEKDKEFLGAPL